MVDPDRKLNLPGSKMTEAFMYQNDYVGVYQVVFQNPENVIHS
jgi:hypothetical protein